MAFRILPWLLLPILASCVAPRSAPPAAPEPPPRAPVAPLPPAAPAPERYAGDWSVADAAPGEWRYAEERGSSLARFAGADGVVLAEIACSGGTISLTRTGIIPQDIGAFINVRSSFAERRLPIQSANQSTRRLTTRLPARDPLWDQIIFSRGRFLVEATGQAPIIVPTRGDVARVIEDCRG